MDRHDADGEYVCMMAQRGVKKREIRKHKGTSKLPATTEREGVVPLPGRPARGVVVTVTFAETTVLNEIYQRYIYYDNENCNTPSCQCW